MVVGWMGSRLKNVVRAGEVASAGAQLIKRAGRFQAFGFVVALTCSYAVSAMASDKELLDVLLENGTITPSQHRRLLRGGEGEAVEEDADQVQAESAEPSVSVDHTGVTFESGDGDFSLNLSGRVHAQVSGHEGDLPAGVDATDGSEIRRARIALKGRVFGHWIWNSEVDFADNETGVRDFWFGYDGFANTRLYLGHQKQPYSLSVEMSTNDFPFIERSVDNDLVIPFIDRAVGIRVDTFGSNWFLATGFYGESVDATREDDEGWGAAGRIVFTPIRSDHEVLHLGARAAYRRTMPSSGSIRLRDETTHMSNFRVVDTGAIEGTKGVTLVGGEAAFVLGPFSVFGEYNQAFVDRKAGPDMDFDSWHVATTWTITGESRAKAYRLHSGEFKRLQPLRNFSLDGGFGAWEFAARLASLDTNDGPVRGGEEMVVTSALNWYINPVVRMMFEWSRIVDTDDSTELRNAAEDLNIFQFRGQFAF